jgi:aspartate-semialdehyde dehydrogenase
VGIVGATGAVGKEIRSVLENRSSEFPVSELRVFGSERSAGRTIETEAFGTVTVEPFSVDAARECDVVFLAVSGDFALEHAKALAEGDDGCVVIDNSVRWVWHCSGNAARNQGTRELVSGMFPRV